MPEGPEVDTDKLREAIDEEIEKQGSAVFGFCVIRRVR